MCKKLRFVFFCTLFILNSVILCSCQGSSSGIEESPSSSVSKTDASDSGGSSTDSGNSDDSGSKQGNGSRGSTLHVLSPSADGTVTYESDSAVIDASNTSEGYIMVNYTGSNEKVKLQITGPENNTYTYTLHDGFDTFPLTEGDGNYNISIFENISGEQYATALSQDISVSITNEFGPYLYPNQYVNFTESTAAISTSEELAASTDTDLDVVANVYNYILEHVTYDYDKAESVQSGYLPDVDDTLATGKGICFDYAAVMATMLRVQGIPTRMELGYFGDIYHAWVSVYIEDVGWINGLIEFDGSDWKMLDPTFASTSSSPESFVPKDSDYSIKYVY